MTPELARELREAGFPNIQDVQHRQGRQFLTADGQVTVYSIGDLAPEEDWFIPILEELIEACGDNFQTLQRQSSALKGRTIWACDPVGWYDTPEEAVARLWLALNKQ
jgi:hypothetical protein